MFRLRQADNPDKIFITIEGELRGDSVAAAEAACHAALLKGVRVVILINDVTEIDEEGRAFLRRMAEAKAQLRASGIYSRYVIKSIQQDRKGLHRNP